MLKFLVSVLLTALVTADPDDPYQDCWNFLVTYMPDRDKTFLSHNILNETITYALLSREMFPYAKNVPWDIFQNYVLPYFILNEARDNWRKLFFERLSPVAIKYYSRLDVAYYFVNNLWHNFGFNVNWQSDSTPLVMSPFEVLTQGYGSCTGHTTTIVAALRSVGVPIRSAGTVWNATCINELGLSENATGVGGMEFVQGGGLGQPGDGNHNWMEIYDDNGYWTFCNSNSCGTYNESWFYPGDVSCANGNNQNYTIWASSYKTADGYYTLPWDYKDISVNAYDVTANYQTTTKK